jgi:hypothetical protein
MDVIDYLRLKNSMHAIRVRGVGQEATRPIISIRALNGCRLSIYGSDSDRMQLLQDLIS